MYVYTLDKYISVRISSQAEDSTRLLVARLTSLPSRFDLSPPWRNTNVQSHVSAKHSPIERVISLDFVPLDFPKGKRRKRFEDEGKDEERRKERRGKERKKKRKKKKAPVERNLVSRRSGGETADGRRSGEAAAARGRERAEVGDPDVLIKRLIFIARQKREFNAHRRLMRRPTAARG